MKSLEVWKGRNWGINLISFCVSAVYCTYLHTHQIRSVWFSWEVNQHSIKWVCRNIDCIEVHGFCLAHILIGEYLVNCKELEYLPLNDTIMQNNKGAVSKICALYWNTCIHCCKILVSRAVSVHIAALVCECCSVLDVYQCLRGTCCLLHQGKWIIRIHLPWWWRQNVTLKCQIPDHIASHSRRLESSLYSSFSTHGSKRTSECK